MGANSCLLVPAHWRLAGRKQVGVGPRARATATAAAVPTRLVVLLQRRKSARPDSGAIVIALVRSAHTRADETPIGRSSMDVILRRLYIASAPFGAKYHVAAYVLSTRMARKSLTFVWVG